MAAGGILVTHPETTIYTGNVNRIVIVDGNGVQHDVQQVYWCPDGIEAKLVWPAISRTLLAGDKCVAIELDLTNETSDITVTSIEIFTSQTTSSTTGRIKIIHSSGLYVGAFDGNTTDSSTEKYGLTGVPRSVDSISVTLYAGEKYYLVFNDSSTSLYYPAYFQNENGNYIANFDDNAQANTLYPYQNVTVIKDYLPAGGGAIQEVDLQSILKLDTNELFLWNGNNLVVNQQTIIKDDHLGKKLTTKVTNPPITTSDADIWSYANQQIFVRHNYGSEAVNRIWKKTATTNYNGTMTLTKSDGIGQFIEILLALGDSTQAKVLTNNIDYYFQDDVNKLFQLKSGYSPDSTLSFTPLNYLPAGTEKHFYYIEGGYDIWGDYNHGTALYVYENGAFSSPIYGYNHATFKSYMIMTALESTIEQISLTTLVQEDQQVSCNSSVKTSTISTDRKYYVKLNGNEFPR